MAITNEAVIEFVESWRENNGIGSNDVLTQEQLIKLATDVQGEVGKLSFDAPVQGANIIPYNGRLGTFPHGKSCLLSMLAVAIQEFRPGMLLLF